MGSDRVDFCNWRIAILVSERDPILVESGFIVYSLKTDIKQFLEVTNKKKYRKLYFKDPNEIGSLLPCGRCGGYGTTDWIQKVMKTKNYIGRDEIYKKDPYSNLLEFSLPIENNPFVWAHQSSYYSSSPFLTINQYRKNGTYYCKIYSSRPNLEDVKEYCQECHGSGLELTTKKMSNLVGEIK